MTDDGGSFVLHPVGRDRDGRQLFDAVVSDAVIPNCEAELRRRGDVDHGWADLLCGPGGWVEPPGREPFRVVRVLDETGAVLHTYPSMPLAAAELMSPPDRRDG